MGFQTTVNILQGFGVPGQRYDMSPMRAVSYILNSSSSSLNIMGATAFSLQAGPPDGIAVAGNPSNTEYLGILVNPEMQALFGANNQPLSASLVVNNGVVAALATMGRFWVTLPAACNVGDVVIFDNTTGALSTITPGTSLPGGKTAANASVFYYTPNASGSQLAAIELTPVPPLV
jgi:hypothetical protein